MTPEQEALLRKAGTTLEGARLLAAHGLYDAAVSRAYYVMFYVAEAFLLGDSIALSKHSAVISEFGRRLVKTGRVPADFHRYLIDGQDSRIKSDYDTESVLDEAQATVQLAHAEQFVALAASQISSLPDKDGEQG